MVVLALRSSRRQCQMRSAIKGVEPVLIRISVVSNGKGGVKHVHAKRVVEFRDRSPPGWPLLWAQVEECARCAVPVGGLRRNSDLNELASAAVRGAARSGPRFVAPWFLLLAGYENLTAPNAIMQS